MSWTPVTPAPSAVWTGMSVTAAEGWVDVITTGPTVPWLLAYGLWRDGGLWDDTQFWQDGSTWSPVITGETP